MANIIVGGIFALILGMAFNKVIRNMKNNTCPGCNACSGKNKCCK